MKPLVIGIIIGIVFGIGIGFTLNVSAEDGLIPEWVKNIALWYGEGVISEHEFIDAILFLIKEGILVIPLEQNEKEEKTDVSQLTVEELEELSISWEYKDILRNIEKYEGKIIHLTGFIWRVEADGGDRYVLTVWAEPDDNIFYVDYTGSKLLYADTIEVYVTVERIVEVESMLGEAFVNPYPYVKAIQLTCTNC